MIKTIIKEGLIMLLLCIAIMLLIGILFYDYIPTNKVIPQKEAYITSENVKEEINEQITEIEKTEISYEITDSDLAVYEETSSYKPGKPDPFSLTTGTVSNTIDSDTNDNLGNGKVINNTAENNNNTNNNSTNTFFNDEGIK